MKLVFRTMIIFVLAILGNSVCAQNQIQYVYEDNTNNNGKVEWTRSVEVNDAAVGVGRKIQIPIKNISTEPLIILEVRTHCGCTEASAPKDAIAPGQIGYVDVVFTAKARYENEQLIPPPFTFYQIIDVTTNFDTKNSIVLSVQGTVIK